MLLSRVMLNNTRSLNFAKQVRTDTVYALESAVHEQDIASTAQISHRTSAKDPNTSARAYKIKVNTLGYRLNAWGMNFAQVWRRNEHAKASYCSLKRGD